MTLQFHSRKTKLRIANEMLEAFCREVKENQSIFGKYLVASPGDNSDRMLNISVFTSQEEAIKFRDSLPTNYQQTGIQPFYAATSQEIDEHLKKYRI